MRFGVKLLRCKIKLVTNLTFLILSTFSRTLTFLTEFFLSQKLHILSKSFDFFSYNSNFILKHVNLKNVGKRKALFTLNYKKNSHRLEETADINSLSQENTFIVDNYGLSGLP